jgi:hypothetical protein
MRKGPLANSLSAAPSLGPGTSPTGPAEQSRRQNGRQQHAGRLRHRLNVKLSNQADGVGCPSKRIHIPTPAHWRTPNR